MTRIAVGILGVGHLTSHMVPGLLAGDLHLDILLSPRNAERAQRLKAVHGTEIAPNNHRLVENCDVILVGVRQFDAVDVMKPLPWRDDQTVISCCAGLPLAQLAPHVGGATLVRAMPTIGAEIQASPTCIFPDNETANAVLANCGSVVPLASEDNFNAAIVTVCYSSALFGLMARMADWNEKAGIDAATSRRLVSELTRSSAEMATQRADLTLDMFIEQLATPGSFTIKAFDALARTDAFGRWTDMCDELLGELANRSTDAT